MEPPASRSIAVMQPEARRHSMGHALAASAPWLNGIALLAAPAAAYFGLQLRGMVFALTIDPFLSTAYAVNGPDLIRRFGTDEYYWTRVGFSIPAHLFDRVFGPTGGYFGFRYLLALIAIVPLFLLIRRLWGTVAGWIGVVAVLTSAVLITGWSTDYPTSAAISYLMAGAALLFMPAATTRARVLWALLAGAAFGLAAGSGLVALVVVAGAFAGRLVATTRPQWRATAVVVISAGAGLVVSFALVALAAKVYLGNADIVSPQLQALHRFGEPVYKASFHSTTWRWLIDDIYVLAPPAVLAGWVVTAWPFKAAVIPRAEVGVAAATGVTYLLFAVYQFLLGSWSLEYWLYADMLWVLTVPLLVLIVLRIASGGAQLSRIQAAVVGVSILATPIVIRVLRDHLHLSLKVAAAVAVVPALAVLAARIRPAVAVRAGTVVATVAAYTLLVMGQPVFTQFPGQVGYVTPDLGTALYGSSQPALDEYAVVTRLHTVVPAATSLPGGLAMWLPPASSHLVLISSAQYLFLPHALPDPMATLTANDVAYITSQNIRVLVLLGDTAQQVTTATAAVLLSPVRARTVSSTVLKSGSATLYVAVMQVS